MWIFVSFETLFSKRIIFNIQVLWQNVGETEGLCAILPNQKDWNPKADGASWNERENRGGGSFLSRPTSRCILFDGEIRLMLVLLYI
jgi:hypothetical protein